MTGRAHPLIYLIAGEHSGDLLGARFMAALKAKDSGISFAGIGGPRMEAEGMNSRLPLSELAMMGFAEIVPHIPRLLGQIRDTANHIRELQPDAVITIDAPGFCTRVIKRLRSQTDKLPLLVHYVAPSVWAYKPGRARKFAKLYNLLLTLLPFEPPYFEREGLKAIWVGHPVIHDWRSGQGDGAAFRNRHGIPADAPLLCLLPGSRRGELSQHLPLFRKTVIHLKDRIPGLGLIMPVPPDLMAEVQNQTRNWPDSLRIVNSEVEKRDAFAACNAALAKSGTVTLELSLARVPMVVTYKVNPLTAWLMRRLIRTKYVNLVNIVAGKEIIPERLQEQATPRRLAQDLETLLHDKAAAQGQVQDSKEALRVMGADRPESPSERAAEAILSALKRGIRV